MFFLFFWKPFGSFFLFEFPCIHLLACSFSSSFYNSFLHCLFVSISMCDLFCLILVSYKYHFEFFHVFRLFAMKKVWKKRLKRCIKTSTQLPKSLFLWKKTLCFVLLPRTREASPGEKNHNSSFCTLFLGKDTPLTIFYIGEPRTTHDLRFILFWFLLQDFLVVPMKKKNFLFLLFGKNISPFFGKDTLVFDHNH